jgi:hypothetical protein
MHSLTLDYSQHSAAVSGVVAAILPKYDIFLLPQLNYILNDLIIDQIEINAHSLTRDFNRSEHCMWYTNHLCKTTTLYYVR